MRRLSAARFVALGPIKLKGKTVCVALAEEQASQMLQAIDNHKRLEKIKNARNW